MQRVFLFFIFILFFLSINIPLFRNSILSHSIKMNHGDDLIMSKGVTQALTRAIFDCLNRIAVDCLAEMEREREQAEQVPRPRLIHRRTFVRHEHDVAHQRLFADHFADEPRLGPTVFINDLKCRGIFF